MTENEAIKNIKALNAVCWDKDFYGEEFAKAMAKAVKALHEIQQYRAIGTIEEFKALKEKNVAKKPIERERNYLKVFDCPVCNAELYSGQRYCDECGQVILDDYE